MMDLIQVLLLCHELQNCDSFVMSFHGWCIHSAVKCNAPFHCENIAHRLLEVDTGLDAWGS